MARRGPPAAPASPASAKVSGLVLGGVATYTIVVNNLGDQPLANVALDASIPDGATFDSLVATPSDATWQGATSDGVHWTVPSVRPGASEGPFVYRVDLGTATDPAPVALIQWDGAKAPLQVRGGVVRAISYSGSR